MKMSPALALCAVLGLAACGGGSEDAATNEAPAPVQIVEGKVYMARSGTPDEKTYSRLEFERGLQKAVEAAGGVRVASSEPTSEAIDEIPETIRQDMRLGMGPMHGNPFTSYVIRRADRTIWLQVVSDSHNSAWAVVEAPAP